MPVFHYEPMNQTIFAIPDGPTEDLIDSLRAHLLESSSYENISVVSHGGLRSLSSHKSRIDNFLQGRETLLSQNKKCYPVVSHMPLTPYIVSPGSLTSGVFVFSFYDIRSRRWCVVVIEIVCFCMVCRWVVLGVFFGSDLAFSRFFSGVQFQV